MPLYMGDKNMRRKKIEMATPLEVRRSELSMEVNGWWHKIDRQLDEVLAQYQMTFLFPSGSPDDLHTKEVLEREQTHLRNMVAEYDLARLNLHNFAKEYGINCAEFEDSHTAIRTMLRWKNKK